MITICQERRSLFYFPETPPQLFDRLTTIFSRSIMFITVNKTDLKQISKLLDDKLDSKFDEKLAPIQKTLSEHGKMLESHGKMLKSHGKILISLKKDQNMMLGMLDEEQMKQKRRLTKIEAHLGLTPAS
jgi:hypothetical protein